MYYSVTRCGVIYFGSCQDQRAISGDDLFAGRAQSPSDITDRYKEHAL